MTFQTKPKSEAGRMMRNFRHAGVLVSKARVYVAMEQPLTASEISQMKKTAKTMMNELAEVRVHLEASPPAEPSVAKRERADSLKLRYQGYQPQDFANR